MRVYEAVLFTALSFSCCLAQVTHEETVVRESYAKLSFAAQLGMVWHTARQHPGWPSLDDPEGLRHAMQDQLRFELSGFKVGAFSGIAAESFDSLVSSPDEAIRIDYHEASYTVDTPRGRETKTITYADSSWIHARKGDKPVGHVITVAEGLPNIRSSGPALTVTGQEQWQRYASFGVVASLAGKSFSYRALFLFRKTPNGGEVVLPLDFATQMGIVPFLNNPLYPAALVETSLREISFVQGWIHGNSVAGCKTTKVPEVCCAKKDEACGIAAEDLQRSLELQIDPDTRTMIPNRLEK